MSVDAMVEGALGPLDRSRAAALALIGPHVASLFAAREARALAIGLSVIASSLLLTAVAPLWLLALGPLVLGVPHLLADARYLVIEPGLHRRRALAVAVGVALAFTWLKPSLTVGLGAAAAAVLFSRASVARRAAGLAIVGLAWLAAERAGRSADVAFAHAHNLVAVAAFVFWFRRDDARGRRGVAAASRPRSSRLAFAATFAAAGLFILTGGLDTTFVALRAYDAPRSGLTVEGLMAALSTAADPRVGLRLVLFFAFAQSVHYGVWLRLVPELARERRAPRPFRASYRALQASVGQPLILLTLGLTAGLAVYALGNVAAARNAYLRLAFFHGHLEMAVLALLFVERRPLGAGRTAPVSDGATPS